MRDCKRVIETYHDPSPLARIRIALAPCSPFSVTPELLMETRRMADQYGVHFHTHLSETKDEDEYCERIYGQRPFDFMEKMQWNSDRAWFAHCVHWNEDEIKRVAHWRGGVAHCPTSNFRLGSGLAPIREMRDAGVRVGLGVDGSASNDSSDMIGEVRQCMWAQRARLGPTAMSAREALTIATRGGADVLGYEKLGSLQPGWGADFFTVNLNHFGYAGALHDPVAAVFFSGFDHRVDTTVVDGQVLVRDGRLLTVDEAALAARANQIARSMVERATARTGIDFLARDARRKNARQVLGVEG